MACANAWGFRSPIFLKMRMVGCIIFLVCPSFNFFKVQVVSEAVHLSPWEIFVRKLSSVLLKHKFVRALLLPTFVFAQWWLIEAASCPRAQML